jgi:hypothetical protein
MSLSTSFLEHALLSFDFETYLCLIVTRCRIPWKKNHFVLKLD